ncbi:class I SAM-dependent DNA methyltransferase [Desulfuromonas sp. DDH964]|uniref:class I SAM-dependent DNA methyltransferase n=1 Tax=Desulfuromonas sp. DDH964 TaxID=1823759 RepID=UPI00078E482A|nr:DNA methyltransferase [Desulfuromonas sp. DDH964]AMV70513.1 DNA methyltransferase [Desulfuromonas sp. DDH964]
MSEERTNYVRAHASIDAFITAWKASGGAERANYQLFLTELCHQLDAPLPEPTRPDDSENAYVFERTVTLQHGDGNTSPNYIDLYKRGCFVLEAKQGSDKQEPAQFKETEKKYKTGTARRGTQGWDRAMQAAKNQAERYAKALPTGEGWPPFLLVVDVGHSIELYSEFSCTGKAYLPFPDPRSHRIHIGDLARPEVRELLRSIWTDPHSLDPAKRSAKVTREVADKLARLAKSLEAAGHSSEKVGNFLKRSLFTMFAEDIGLIPNNSYTELLTSLRGSTDKYVPMVESLWQTMKDGGFSPVLREKLLRFNGGLFEGSEALPLNEDQLEMLIQAGKADWKDVEPAIFGTLLERALNPTERHHLGAHYTPREYVERLVLPTVVEPLRVDWEAVLAAAVALDTQGKRDEAVAQLQAFHHHLCGVRVLDPACGSGNFLYVTFEHLKRLEGEVLDALEGFGETQELMGLAGTTVDPHQLLGIEVNPRAAAITDMVLWIGYLQWHYRTRGDVQPPEPVIKKFRNIECRDAVLSWERTEPVVDEDGTPVTRWDGVTTKTHPVTGEQVPDDTSRVPLLRYVNPRKAEWPDADFVVGNPPFLGKQNIRPALGDSYVETLRNVWLDVPDSVDFVMYWWHKAAELARLGKLRRFGFITTNSLTQKFNRKVVETHLIAVPSLSLAFAIPDHPWVDSADGAAVRIAMTVGRPAKDGDEGRLVTVAAERGSDGEGIAVDLITRQGVLHADLRVGANVASAQPLLANSQISGTGYILGGRGFVLTAEEADRLRHQGAETARLIFPLSNGDDIVGKARHFHVIDAHGLTEEQLRRETPGLWQRLYERVYPERQINRDPKLRANWWLFRRSNELIRSATAGLHRFVVTPETAKHRIFSIINAGSRPEHKLICIATDSAYHLGVLSSRAHVTWALAAGGRLGVGNDPVYSKTRCFEPFPFPVCSDTQQQRIRDLAEQLDSHRKRQQEQHPDLTLTGMYNVLEKLRSGAELTAKEKVIHEQGLVSVLRQLHDELDAAVADAYGWPADLTDEAILERLVALNKERTGEEEQGLVRWLRPEYQNPSGRMGESQGKLPGSEETAAPVAAKEKPVWPKTLPEQVAAVRAALTQRSVPTTALQLKEAFKHAREPKVQEILTALASIGQAREVGPGAYTA